jgi:hypothetical protein
VLLSPVIGLLIGSAVVRLRPSSKLVAAFISLLTLYSSATLFGLAVGLYDYWTGSGNRNAIEVIFQPVPAVLWGLTITTYVVLLWPLAYWNHVLLWQRYGPDD